MSCAVVHALGFGNLLRRGSRHESENLTLEHIMNIRLEESSLVIQLSDPVPIVAGRSPLYCPVTLSLRGGTHGLDNPDPGRDLHRPRDQRLSARRILTLDFVVLGPRPA
jgi:hypothetical protein